MTYLDPNHMAAIDRTAEARDAVERWRAKYPRIVEAWRQELEAAQFSDTATADLIDIRITQEAQQS